MSTSAVFFPFDLFGSGGAGAGARLLADALREMLADNKAERKVTRARAYQEKVRVREIEFPNLASYGDWRAQGRELARRALERHEFLLWVAGNHLGVLPVYEELAGHEGTLVIQLDAHLDVYNLSDCTAELSHGNFLLHCEGQLPRIVNVGSRELLLRPDHVARYYAATFPASELAIDPTPALGRITELSRSATRVFVDIDCDVLDPAFFGAVSHPMPFGISPQLLLQVLDAAWSGPVAGVALSEFEPARDRNDACLSMLVWFLEFLLLKRYEG